MHEPETLPCEGHAASSSASTHGEAIVRAEGLTKDFGPVRAVDNLSLSIGAGEILVLLGSNGAGKTTTVRMLASIIPPTQGHAWIAGCDVLQQAETSRAHVGLLTEFPGLYPRMFAVEYLDFFANLYDLPAERRRGDIEHWLQRLGLWESRFHPLAHYSKGMAQKLAIARALLHNPLALFLDEPTSALDPHSARLVRDIIREQRALGKAILVCTHNLQEAEELADRIAIMVDGTLLASGTIEELRAQYLPEALCEVHFAGLLRESWLDALDGLVAVVELGDTWMRYRIDQDHILEINPVILARLTQAGAPVVSVELLAHSLETIYLAVMRAHHADKELEGEHAPPGRSPA